MGFWKNGRAKPSDKRPSTRQRRKSRKMFSRRFRRVTRGGAGWRNISELNVIFSLLVRIDIDGVPYPIFSYTALLSWTFFATSLSFAIPSLVNNLNLVTKIYFPREILPIASVGAAFSDFLIASLLLVAALIWYRTPVTPALGWVPLLLLLQILLTLGIVLPAAAFNVNDADIAWVDDLCVNHPVATFRQAARLTGGLDTLADVRRQ